MNNDLIRRSATCNQLISSIDWLREHDYELYCAIGDSICCCIDEMPTAYDVDKVVENIEKIDDGYGVVGDAYQRGASDGAKWTKKKAIEIVKGGGVDE